MGINANVSGGQQITASVGETKIDVAVSGGVGPSGASGAAGAAATITVGTVTTGAPGSSASVVNAGTTSAAVLNFTIPAGATGATGPQGATGPAGTTTWGGITDKPSAFNPTSHQHVAADITDFTSAVVAAAPPTTNASLLTSGTLPDARLSANIARTSDVSSAVAAVVNAAPAALDTLQELAAALGNDASFAATVTNSLAGKASLVHTHTVSAITDAGTAATRNVPATGNASSSEVVLGSDTRLTDARTPTAHSHVLGDVTGLQTALDAKAASNHSHGNLTSDGRIGTLPVRLIQTTSGGLLTAPSFPNIFVSIVDCTAVDCSGNVSGTWQGTAIGLAYGGTGATTAAGALTNLGAVATTDARLSDARTPTAHNQAWSTITSTPTTLAGYGITDAVASNDARLTDARTPLSHTHSAAQVTDFTTAAAAAAPVQSVAGRTGAVTIAAADVSGLAASATTDTTNASNIGSGTLAAARIGTHATSHNPGGSDPVTLVEFFEFTRSSKPAAATGSNGSYNFAIPAAAKMVEFLLVGAGGGGGSGRRGAANTARFGGGGGSGGNVTFTTIPRSLITTNLQIFLAAGGAGGAAQTSDDSNGNAGTTAGTATIAFNGVTGLIGLGGAGGGAGTTTTGTGANSGGNNNRTYAGGAGGSSSITANAAIGGGAGGISPFGGAGGGGISAANVAYNGGNAFSGGGAFYYVAGVTTSTGGAASTTADGGTGADGRTLGYGGSGGGASANGFNSGAGGNGGDAYLRITVWY